MLWLKCFVRYTYSLAGIFVRQMTPPKAIDRLLIIMAPFQYMTLVHVLIESASSQG